MTEVVVKYDKGNNEYHIYENTSQTLIMSRTLGEGFSNLNLFLIRSGQIQKSLIEDEDVIYHFDGHTFKEIIKSNMALLKRVSDIPSEFKNSANKFGMPSVPKDLNTKNKQNFSKGSSNFQKGKMTGFKGSKFGNSFGKFNKK
jgi:hypothetical protein